MGWGSALTKARVQEPAVVARYAHQTEDVDFAHLVSLDFETYYDADYTLSKMSTSEYVRDKRFEALMLYLKVGNRPARIIPGPKIKAELQKINWDLYSALCHNTHFDGLILSHHYKVKPRRLYCSLSMARGLHSNDIGAGLDEVSIHYGGQGKIPDALEDMKGVHFAQLFKDKARWKRGADYCMNDGEEMLRVFKLMLPSMPRDEMDLIHLTNRMFCDPVLKVDIPRVEKEFHREVEDRKRKLLDCVDEADYTEAEVKAILKTKAERLLSGEERQMLFAKRVIGSNEKFAALLRAEGIEPPVKISKAWIAKDRDDRTEEGKYSFAFAKDDLEFINLPDNVELLSQGLNLAKVADVKRLAARQARIKQLVEARLAVKSTTNITRAERFLKAGANGWALPVGYAYYRAHTGRWGGTNKMNMQNLTRGGELRLSILAPAGYVVCVADSGQIEARVNGWLWGQADLLDAFRDSDAGTGMDAYCRFATQVYGRTITKDDKTERFVGKVCVLGLGFQMGAPKLQMTLAKGALGGPPVYFTLQECEAFVRTYRRMNYRIEKGWKICSQIIEDMAAGRPGRHGPITWEKETIWLPNGMCLKYPDLKKRQGDRGFDEWTYQAKDMRKKIYGGLLCENIVQALARIIVATQMLAIDKFSRVVMTTHDEVVSLTKKAAGAKTVERMIKVMRTPLDWCKDIPLNAEGGFDVCYSK
jgi:hypothetical protein